MATTTEAPKLQLLPQYASVKVEKPGSRTGKGGNPHHYLVDEQKFSRCTTVLNDTIPKPGLVPWAKNMALEKVRHTLLEVTSDNLDNGAWDTHPQWVNGIIDAARKRPDEIRDEAAEWGTRAHKAIQEYIDYQIAGEDGYIVGNWAPTLDAFKGFSDSLGVQWAATEMTVWHDELLVAGTVDAIGYYQAPCTAGIQPCATHPNGATKWVIADWKTGKSFYPEMALQLSAYAAMFERITGNPVAEAYVVRFPREQPEPVECTKCTGKGGKEQCPTCNDTYLVQPPSFEVRKVADPGRGWERYQELVAQRQYVSDGVWKE